MLSCLLSYNYLNFRWYLFDAMSRPGRPRAINQSHVCRVKVRHAIAAGPLLCCALRRAVAGHLSGVIGTSYQSIPHEWRDYERVHFFQVLASGVNVSTRVRTAEPALRLSQSHRAERNNCHVPSE
jgi:hypothetical protein